MKALSKFYGKLFVNGVLLPLLLMCPFCLVEAEPVEFNDAQKVACNFMRWSFGKTDIVDNVVTFDTLGFTAMYAFNFKNGGYVLTSGSQKSDPILAYSETGTFLPEDSIDNDNLLGFLSDCKYEVINREQNQLKSLNTETYQKWDTWMADAYYPHAYEGEDIVTEVPNLLYDANVGGAVEWMQSKCEGEGTVTIGGITTNNNTLGICYNIMMPSSQSCEHTIAGCTPTALAQVMWKWKWPNSVSYTYKGEQYESQYTWDSMPPYLSVKSTVRNMNEVSTLLRDCGYMLEAEFGCGGTSADNEDIYKKLVKENLIGYNAYGNIYTTEYSRRFYREATDTYSTSEWLSLVITELIAGRPVILASAPDNNRGHSYIISGFQRRDDGYYFYVNLGWGLSQNHNGYYNIDFSSNYHISEQKKSATIGFSPKKGNENHEHDIHVTCTQSTIGKAGKLSFYVENANSYILKIKYMTKTTNGYSSSGGARTCFYRSELQENIVDRLSGNIFKDGEVEVWYKENAKLEYEYSTYCDELTAPTMYEITFMNNYGEVVTYEGTFEAEYNELTDMADEPSQDGVLIYPNPSTGIFSVSAQKKIDKITVHNVFGSVVKTIESTNKTKLDFDLSDYATGCYYITIETENSRIVKPIIKK